MALIQVWQLIDAELVQLGSAYDSHLQVMVQDIVAWDSMAMEHEHRFDGSIICIGDTF